MSDSIARQLVRELVGAKPDGFSDAARDKAALCLVDFLSCAFAGAQMPCGQRAVAAARPWSFPAGVAAIATDVRVSPGEAAYLNSILAASASRTDMHPASTSHPAAVIFPVAFACCGIPGISVSGRDFIAAVIAGYEAMGRLGRIVVVSEFKKRFRSTSVLGTIGGAITAARLLGLDETQAVNGLSISVNTAAGLMAWGHTGEVDLFYQPANAARAAITAALLAKQGSTSSETIFESAGGFFEAFGGMERAQQLTRRATEGWEIELVDYKPVPACVFVQAAAFATRKVVDEHQLRGDDVAGVKLRTFASAVLFPGCDNAGPIDAMQPARMSIQYTVGSVLARGGLTDRNFADIGNPLTDRIAADVALEVTDEFTRAFPARQGAEIEVTTRQGRKLTARVDEVPVVLPARVRERFRESAAGLYDKSKTDRIEKASLGCAGLADMSTLLEETRT